jgi:hypothetical protein
MSGDSETERRSRASETLSRALELPEAERKTFLTEAIREQPTLRMEILTLIENLGAAEKSLERGPLDARALDSFGPYRVIRELGEGPGARRSRDRRRGGPHRPRPRRA